jgi:hypothetical protein
LTYALVRIIADASCDPTGRRFRDGAACEPSDGFVIRGSRLRLARDCKWPKCCLSWGGADLPPFWDRRIALEKYVNLIGPRVARYPFSSLRQKFGLIACLDRSIAPAKPMRPQAGKKCGHLEPWKKKSYGA